MNRDKAATGYEVILKCLALAQTQDIAANIIPDYRVELLQRFCIECAALVRCRYCPTFTFCHGQKCCMRSVDRRRVLKTVDLFKEQEPGFTFGEVKHRHFIVKTDATCDFVSLGDRQFTQFTINLGQLSHIHSSETRSLS